MEGAISIFVPMFFCGWIIQTLIGWMIGRTKGRGFAGFMLSFFFGFFGWIAVGLMDKKS